MKILRKKYFFVIYILFIFLLSLGVILFLQKTIDISFFIKWENKQWEIRSIDTMKYSRDLAREKIFDKTYSVIIDKQMEEIAATGANYAAIGTPYDDEFHSVLISFVNAARKHNLRVWFRGNFSGWEGWFGYQKIDEAAHIIKTQQFILNNKDLFEDGDIFTSCTECENGTKMQWGDTRSLDNHRAFLMAEYNVTKEAFAKIGKKVKAGYYSMNGDLATALMDSETTKALGGVVVIDHYVGTPEKLAQDIRKLARQSGGKIVLGEFGAPIPDIHGKMTGKEQDEWLNRALSEISTIPELIGVNYWVNKGGSTALWNDDGTKRPAVKTITNFYSQK